MNVSRVRQRLDYKVARLRVRSRLVDHLARALAHYNKVLGSQLAASATYFAFLSFFPLVALVFAAVGYVVEYVPGARDAVTSAMSSVLPGMIGTGKNQLDVEAIARNKTGVGIIGLAVLLYSGLNWISALRTSLQAVFAAVAEDGRNFVLNKVFDLVVLVAAGAVLLVSVGVSTAVTAFADFIFTLAHLTRVPGVGVLLWAVAAAVGVAASSVLFFTLYRLLPRHDVPAAKLWRGALLAALGFEVLKQIAGLVLGTVTGNPLYGAFAVLVALLVWINYFDRLTVLGAAWAVTGVPVEKMTHPEKAGGVRRVRPQGERPGDGADGGAGLAPAGGRARRIRRGLSAAFGAFAGGLTVGWLASRRRRREAEPQRRERT
ncbi:membrane protein [Actinopolymorpha cephalotaxi]|uniref:Membrane protein n=1 Tax=Actinopolymorpha cephalotaxi TaxID=504797 RepID=A0A1I2KS24_9ACTN|nr:YihY/virulence factor BrkB family protein [Actinopolymorpha cephalotaxi]NYH84639.1 membrane protein [Actinopolymorpha cephalotaxi]SFF69842.1 membrane protein [Actinopolymorpha cephalotaxi]